MAELEKQHQDSPQDVEAKAEEAPAAEEAKQEAPAEDKKEEAAE